MACASVIALAFAPLRALSFARVLACVRSAFDDACVLPDIALLEGVAVFADEALGLVLCVDVARSLLLGLVVLLCAKVAPLKARAENSTPAEMRCLPLGFMNFSYVAPGGIPD